MKQKRRGREYHVKATKVPNSYVRSVGLSRWLVQTPRSHFLSVGGRRSFQSSGRRLWYLLRNCGDRLYGIFSRLEEAFGLFGSAGRCISRLLKPTKKPLAVVYPGQTRAQRRPIPRYRTFALVQPSTHAAGALHVHACRSTDALFETRISRESRLHNYGPTSDTRARAPSTAGPKGHNRENKSASKAEMFKKGQAGAKECKRENAKSQRLYASTFVEGGNTK